LKRFGRTSKVCDQNVAISAAVKPLELNDVLKYWENTT
jgi:hypothetical protein